MAGIFFGRAVLTMPENVEAPTGFIPLQTALRPSRCSSGNVETLSFFGRCIFNVLYGHRVRCRDDDAISARDWAEPPLSIDLTYTSNPSYYPRRGGTR